MKKLEVERRKTVEVHRQANLAHAIEIQQKHCHKQNGCLRLSFVLHAYTVCLFTHACTHPLYTHDKLTKQNLECHKFVSL